MRRNLYEDVILTDIDGVVLNWVHSFDQLATLNGLQCVVYDQYSIHKRYGISPELSKRLVDDHNNGPRVGNIKPLRDAVKYIRMLHEEFGYVFHGITALSPTSENYKYRRENLDRLFGEGVFEKIVLTDNSEAKDGVLEDYKDTSCLWVEDLSEAAHMGIKHGLRPVLMKQLWNQDDILYPEVSRVNSWKEIYQMVKDEATF